MTVVNEINVNFKLSAIQQCMEQQKGGPSWAEVVVKQDAGRSEVCKK